MKRVKNKIIASMISATVLFQACAFADETAEQKSYWQLENTLVDSLNKNGVVISDADDIEKPAENASQTLIIYMVGSNLEYVGEEKKQQGYIGGAASRDIAEILQASGSAQNNNDLNIILVTGGSNGWDLNIGREGNNKASSVYRVYKGQLYKDNDLFLDTIKESDFGELLPEEDAGSGPDYTLGTPMLNPLLMNNILKNIREKYKADNYSIIFWDHGGYRGFGDDDTIPEGGKNKSLLYADFSNVLKEMKFDWIGFDSCYMANIHTIEKLNGAADYIIASQDKLSNYGWEYSFLNNLYADPKKKGPDIADDVIKAIEQIHKSYESDKPLTISCVDVNEAKNMIGNYQNLIKQLGYTLDENNNVVAEALNEAESFGENASNQSSGQQLYDLQTLVSYWNSKTDLKDITDIILRSMEQSIIRDNKNDDGAHGISVWFPRSISVHEAKENTDASEDSKSGFKLSTKELDDLTLGTTDFFKKFEDKGLTYTQKGISSKAAANEPDGSYYSVSLNDDQRAIARSAKFWVLRKNDDGTYSKVLVQNKLKADNNGTLSAEYDGKLVYLKSSGLEYNACPYYEGGKFYFYMSEDKGNTSTEYNKDIELEVSADMSMGQCKLINVSDMSPIASKSVNGIADGTRLMYTVENYRDRTAAPDEVPFGDVAQGQNIIRALTTNNLSFEVKELDKEHDYFGMFEIDNVYDMPQFYSGLIPISSKTPGEKTVNAREFGTGQINMKNMKLCGVNITLPIKYSEFVKKGFTCSQLDGTDIKISPNQKLYATAYSKDGSCVSITLGNGGTGAVDYSQADVIGIFASDNSGFDNAMTSKKITETGLGRSAASEDRGSFTVYRYALGSDSVIPTLRDDGTTDGGEHDHAALYVDNATGEIKAVGVSVSPGKTVGSSKSNASGGVPAGWEYTNPSGLGNELLSFNFSLDGRVYNLPLPMNRLTGSGSGWKAQSGVKVKGHNEIMTPLTKGDSTIFVLAANYNDSEADLDKCICTGIRLTENSKANLKLPGGVSAESIPEINNSSFSRVGTPENRWYVYEGSDSEYEEVMRLKKDELFLYRTVKTYKLYGDTTQTGVVVYPY